MPSLRPNFEHPSSLENWAQALQSEFTKGGGVLPPCEPWKKYAPGNRFNEYIMYLHLGMGNGATKPSYVLLISFCKQSSWSNKFKQQISWIYYWLDYYSNRNHRIPRWRNYLPRSIQNKNVQRWIYILPALNSIKNK